MHALTLALPRNKLTITRARLIIGGMEYVSVDEGSNITGYSVQYIRRLIRKHRIEATKKGGMYWVNLESLKTYKAEMDTLGKDKFSPNPNRD